MTATIIAPREAAHALAERRLELLDESDVGGVLATAALAAQSINLVDQDNEADLQEHRHDARHLEQGDNLDRSSTTPLTPTLNSTSQQHWRDHGSSLTDQIAHDPRRV